MFRPLRVQYPDAWYHVMNRGRRRENIFTIKEDYCSYVDLLEELDDVFNVNIRNNSALKNTAR
jgi:putative transposase